MTPAFKAVIPSWKEYGYFSGVTDLCKFLHSIVERNVVMETFFRYNNLKELVTVCQS